MSELQRLSDLIYIMRGSLSGCQNGYCVLAGKATGQHTNASCRCLKSIADIALDLAAEADRWKNRPEILVPDTRAERIL